MANSDQNYFQSIPWCAKLLGEPNLVITPAFSRQYKESTEDALFAETLKSDETIRAYLSFYRRPAPGIGRIDEVYALLSLGYGVNGYPHVCHGGIVATIMDEIMGSLLTVNRSLGNADINDSAVTAYLNSTYLKPVATPQVILVTARFREVKGKKYYIDATVKDHCGAVLASAESLWIGLTKSKEKL